MNNKIKLLPPLMPNFARYEMPVGKKQDGFIADLGFDIADFTEEEANEYAELMKSEFIAHYNKRKSSR